MIRQARQGRKWMQQRAKGNCTEARCCMERTARHAHWLLAGGVGRPKNLITTCLYERTTLFYIAKLDRRTYSPSTQAAVPERVVKYGAVAECQHEVEDQKRGVLHIKCQTHRA